MRSAVAIGLIPSNLAKLQLYPVTRAEEVSLCFVPVSFAITFRYTKIKEFSQDGSQAEVNLYVIKLVCESQSRGFNSRERKKKKTRVLYMRACKRQKQGGHTTHQWESLNITPSVRPHWIVCLHL